MTQTIKDFWKLIQIYCEVLKSKGFNIEVDKKKFEAYCKNVNNSYCNYKNKYMNSIENLDRHKIAAILVTQGLNCNIFKNQDNQTQVKCPTTEGMIYIGAQKILLLCAFDYILTMTNNILKKCEQNIPPFQTFIFPKAWSCETDYINIISRNLYYAQNDYCLNEMELAEKFFLLEYIAIKEYYKEDSDKVYHCLSIAARDAAPCENFIRNDD